VFHDGSKPARTLSASDRLSNGGDDVVFRGKSLRILLGDQFIINPDAELASLAFDEISLDADLLLDERRHTGSAWPVVSNVTVADADAVHRSFLRSKNTTNMACARSQDCAPQEWRAAVAQTVLHTCSEPVAGELT
jgi:hypothetical protein